MTKKIFKSIMIAAGLVLLASLIIIIGSLYSYFSGVQRKQLEEELSLAAVAVEKGGQEYLEELQSREYRLTWVAEDGEVIYDTQSDGENMENHADREEIREALRSSEGKSSRYSTTLLERTFYYAQRLEDGSVLRISVRSVTVWVLVLGMLQPILIVLVSALILSGVLASQLSKHIMEPLNSLDLEKPLENDAYEELAPLLKRINRQHKQMEMQLSELADAERSRREFTANVSHELKTPLQSIMGSAELIENGLVKAEDMPRFVGHIRKEADRLLMLIEDIIRLSRLDEGSEMPLEDVDLYEIAAEVVTGLAGMAEARNVRMDVTGEQVIIKGVHRLLTEIIFNFCDNAIKYNKDGGTVEVSVSRQEGRAVVCVKDSGIGIPPEHQARVFERFYRVDKSRSKESGGTGLGLSIVKHAVQYMNGTIDLQSSPGEGTEIRVAFLIYS